VVWEDTGPVLRLNNGFWTGRDSTDAKNLGGFPDDHFRRGLGTPAGAARKARELGWL